MERLEEFLGETESCFNWSLLELETYKQGEEITRADYFKNKLKVSDSVESFDPQQNWPLRLVYSFELFQTDSLGACPIVDEIIREISTSEDIFVDKYRIAFLHVVYSTKACMILKSNQMDEVERLVTLIKPKIVMSEEEISGLLAMKAHVLRLYGPVGTDRSLPLLEEAIRKNPGEVEWPLSLVVSMTRTRHQLGDYENPWSEIEKPVVILEGIVNRPDVTPRQATTCKYFLAVTYSDYYRTMRADEGFPNRKKRMLMLCNDIYRLTDHPQIRAFCASQFTIYGDKLKGREIVEESLQKFPYHVGLNTTASNIYRKMGNNSLAVRYAQNAVDKGGYGSAWTWLACKVDLKEPFDEDEFFNRLLTSFPAHYKKRTYLEASMYYLFQKGNIVKAAYYMELAITQDPKFNGIHENSYIKWIGKKIRPAEVVYNQIVRQLQEGGNNEILLSAKLKIEEVAEVNGFNMEDHPHLVESRLDGRSISGQGSVLSVAKRRNNSFTS